MHSGCYPLVLGWVSGMDWPLGYTVGADDSHGSRWRGFEASRIGQGCQRCAAGRFRCASR
jgi:hypothetical protein